MHPSKIIANGKMRIDHISEVVGVKQWIVFLQIGLLLDLGEPFTFELLCFAKNTLTVSPTYSSGSRR